MDHSILVKDFIDQVWNKRLFENLGSFLHPQFKDHSLPPSISADQEGTKKWIVGTGHSFEHHTTIESQVTEGEMSIIKIKMHLKHTGTWRDIEPTGTVLEITGFRQFKIEDGRIIEHWALIDGQAIEQALNNTNHGCKIAG